MKPRLHADLLQSKLPYFIPLFAEQTIAHFLPPRPTQLLFQGAHIILATVEPPAPSLPVDLSSLEFLR